MPTTQAVKAYGSILEYGVNGTTYTKLAQTVDLGGFQPEVGDINITNNDSPNNTKEYIPGMIEPGTYDFSIIYDSSLASTIEDYADATTVYYWRVTFPNGDKWVARGYVKKVEYSGKTEDGAVEGKISIKITGKPVLTASGS